MEKITTRTGIKMRRWLDVNFFYTWVLMKTEQERKSDLFHKWTLTIFFSCLIRTTIFCHSWIYDIITYTNRKKCVYCMWSTRQTKSICQLDKEDGWYRLKTIRIFYSFIVFSFIRRSTKNDNQLYNYAYHLSIESL